MKLLMRSVFIIVPFLLSSCKKDESLSPPKNSETVSIAIQLPQDIEVLPLGVMYRSDVCHKERTKRNGERYKEPGYHFTKFTLKQDGDSNIYRFPVPFDGGGACYWKLSNVTLNIKYKKEKFNNSVDHVVGTGVIIIFDNNAPQQNSGVDEYMMGDLNIVRDYFPWVDDYKHGELKKVWTYGGKLYVTYKVDSTKKILYTPRSHSSMIIYSTAIQIGDNDKNTQFTYPDGTIVADGSSFPNYEKLLSLIKK